MVYFVIVDRMFFIAYIQLISNLRPSNKQNRGKIHSLKNVVSYRKDKAAGTQFLPSPCGIGDAKYRLEQVRMITHNGYCSTM